MIPPVAACVKFDREVVAESEDAVDDLLRQLPSCNTIRQHVKVLEEPSTVRNTTMSNSKSCVS